MRRQSSSLANMFLILWRSRQGCLSKWIWVFLAFFGGIQALMFLSNSTCQNQSASYPRSAMSSCVSGRTRNRKGAPLSSLIRPSDWKRHIGLPSWSQTVGSFLSSSRLCTADTTRNILFFNRLAAVRCAVQVGCINHDTLRPWALPGKSCKDALKHAHPAPAYEAVMRVFAG